ncbi:hypothetical protein KFE25_005246 [Diacronema lutheri]|uniref:PDZ domain-containing protein n=2 Tax=Diacronema lutheri TaxID=2081491 RepID=A0A8J5X6J6_DIALT|nr:hypothetical protein KFE25_005246 [Diacronema lutheri]
MARGGAALAWLAALNLCGAAALRGAPAALTRHASALRGRAVVAATAPANAGAEAGDDPRVYEVSIGRRTGIDIGCDLSLRWPYVFALVPGGAAELNGQIAVGDQLLGVGRTSVVGATVAETTDLIASAGGDEVLLTLFRGSRAELQREVGFAAGPSTVTIRVVQQGLPDVVFTAKAGCNLRDELVARKINVYRSFTRWTNCSGKQLCGSCIVDVTAGLDACSRRSIDESSTLRENPPSYRLSCITQVHGDITVAVQTPVGAAQWTR